MAPPAPAKERTNAPRAPRHTGSRRALLVLVAPYTLFLLAFGLGPTVYAIIASLLREEGGFAGLQNYATVLGDFRFWPAFGHVAVFMLVWLPTMIVLVTVLALMLHARVMHFSSVMRFVYYLPGAVTGVAAVLLWIFMLDPNVSPFRALLSALGFGSLTATVASGHLPVVFTLMLFFTGAGGWIVIFYGAMQTISREVVEAAVVDGANAIQIAVRIKLPLIRKWIAYMVVLSFAGGVQLFAEPQLLGSATLNVVNPTWSPNQLAYAYAFSLANYGAAAAIAVMVLAISMVGAAVALRLTGFYRLEGEG